MTELCIEHEREGERFVDALLSALTVCCLVALGLKGSEARRQACELGL